MILLKSITKLSLEGLPDSMPGSQPQPGHIGEGCSFYDRCNFSDNKCKTNILKSKISEELTRTILAKAVVLEKNKKK